MSAASTYARVALVTGANKGIGYHIVDQLARGDPNLLVLLCSRDASRGAAAVSQLGLPNVTAVTLDVTSTSSIEHVAGEVQAKYGGIDLLCNNAGVIERGGDTTGSAEAVDHTLAVNYRAVLAMCERFAPIINKNGRIVNVASQLGPAAMESMSPAVRRNFIEQTTIEGLSALVDEFRSSFVARTCRADGWATSVYGVSKAATIVATKILSAQMTNGVTIHSACPGWCKTDMTAGAPAPFSGAYGGEMIVHVLTLSSSDAARTSGEFFERKEVMQWQ